MDVTTVVNHKSRQHLGQRNQHSPTAQLHRPNQNASQTGTLSFWCLSQTTTAARKRSMASRKTTPKISHKNAMESPRHYRMHLAGTSGASTDRKTTSLWRFDNSTGTRRFRNVAATSRHPACDMADLDGNISIESTRNRETPRQRRDVSATTSPCFVPARKQYHSHTSTAFRRAIHQWDYHGNPTTLRHLRGLHAGEDPTPPREYCDITATNSPWYHNGTSAKIMETPRHSIDIPEGCPREAGETNASAGTLGHNEIAAASRRYHYRIPRDNVATSRRIPRRRRLHYDISCACTRHANDIPPQSPQRLSEYHSFTSPSDSP